MKTISTKLLVLFLGIIIFVSLIHIVSSLIVIKKNYIRTFEDQLAKMAALIEPEVVRYYSEPYDLNLLRQTVISEGKRAEIRITVIADDGVVVADSQKDPTTMENHLFRPEVANALSGVRSQNIRYSKTVEDMLLYVAVPIQINGKTTAVLRLSIFMEQLEQLLREIRLRILVAACITIIAAALIALWFSKSITRPIGYLRDGFQAVAEGNLETRVLLQNHDELHDLAEHFNAMVVQLNELFAQINVKEEQIQTIIQSLQEGFAVLDKDGRVVMANDSLKKIARCDAIINVPYWELFRNPDFIELVREVSVQKSSGTTEIEMEGATLFASASYLEAQSEIVLIVHDITRIRQFDRIKKDFVSNVSHELRTPLTAIKGYLETLEEEIGQETGQKKYLEIIKRHTERLIHIVKDLLVLSELENTSGRFSPGTVDINAMIEQTIQLFDKRSQEKGLSLSIALCDNGTITADAFMIEQLLINLIDNAIKYTEKGSISISTERNGNFIIRISDSGIGIPEKDIERIFERFYVVDKSRSRHTGGTGLGLSIVKHIVHLHNGTIKVDSDTGKGTAFTISLLL